MHMATIPGGAVHTTGPALNQVPVLARARKNAALFTKLSISTLDREVIAGRLRRSLALRRVLFAEDELRRYCGLPPSPIDDNHLVLTRVQAAQAIDVSVRTLHRLIERGLVEATPRGRRVLITVDALKRFLRESM
jgi:excisionase family DNA binding protein